MVGEQPESESTPIPFKGFDHLSAGARFLRADLHIHSHGVSTDEADEAMTVEAIVQTAQERQLEVIAIADHNAIDAVEALLAAAAKVSLVAFAGVEITTGEGHLLVYFAPEDYPSFAKWFGKLDFKVDKAGDKYVLTPIRDLIEEVDRSWGNRDPSSYWP